MQPRTTLSVVMPVYDEARIIEQVVVDVLREIAGRLDRVELVIVDDHSTDESGAILDRLAVRDRRIRVHHAARNRGHGPTVRHAIDLADGEWIFQMDSDGELLPEDFWKLWAARADADLLTGCRTQRRDARHRLALSWLARSIVRALAGGQPLKDVNAPFKLVRRQVWTELRPAIPDDPAVPSIMIILGAAIRQHRIVQLPVTHRPRLGGESKLRPPWKLAKLSARAAAQLLVFRVRLTRLPARARRRGRPGQESSARKTL